jgi:hypothetical protein
VQALSTGLVRPPFGSIFAAHLRRRRACTISRIALRAAPGSSGRKVDLMMLLILIVGTSQAGSKLAPVYSLAVKHPSLMAMF